MIFNETYYPDGPSGVIVEPFIRKVVDIICMHSISSFFDVNEIASKSDIDGKHEFKSGGSVFSFEVKRSLPQQLILDFSSSDFDMKYTFELSPEFTNGRHTLYVDESSGESATNAFKKLVEETIAESLEFAKNEGTKTVTIQDGKMEWQDETISKDLEFYTESDGYACTLNVSKERVSYESRGLKDPTDLRNGVGDFTLREFLLGLDGQYWIRTIFSEEVLEKVKEYVREHYVHEADLVRDMRYVRQANDGSRYYLTIKIDGVELGEDGPPQMTMSAASGGSRTVSFGEFLKGDGQYWIKENFDEDMMKAAVDEVKGRMQIRKNIDLPAYGKSIQTEDGSRYDFSVGDDGVSTGYQGPPQMTMSSVSSFGGKATLKDFVEGRSQAEGFILHHFGQEVLDRAMEEAKNRLKNT